MTTGHSDTESASTLRKEARQHAPTEVPANRSWWTRHGRTFWIVLVRVGLLAVAFGVWQAVSGHWIDPLFISKPSDIWVQLMEWSANGTLWTSTWVTLQEIVLGFVLGASAGIVTGFVLGALRVVGEVLDPFMISLYSIPKVALAPLFIIWFGIGIEMKVLLSAVTVYFLVYLNTAAGVRAVDRGLIDALRLMGASRKQLVTKVMIPGSMPGVITGLRVGVPYALIGAVVGELVASNKGLGFLMLDAASQFNTAGVFAALAAITVLAAVFNVGVNLFDRRSSRWKGSAQ